jgi:hypothetical protein
MRKPETHFEQIPVQRVKAMVSGLPEEQPSSQIARGMRLVLNCRICRKPVPMETAKADGDGQAVHEECYVSTLTQVNPVSRKRPSSRSNYASPE